MPAPPTSGTQSMLTGTDGNDILVGTSGDDTIYGLDGNDSIYGLDGSDTLDGAGGNDKLDGGAGDDIMRGGVGDDRYYVDSAGDQPTENFGEGTDVVFSSVTFSLEANLENLNLTGTETIAGTGNELANRIVGNSGDNILNGGAGADVLRGGLGNDRLDGGAGVDLMIGGTGDDVFFVDDSADHPIEYAGEGNDTVISSVGFQLESDPDFAGIENLVLTGTDDLRGYGNDFDNVITGNEGSNLLDGLRGDDTIYGNGGNDELDGFVGDDVLNGGAGNDLLRGSFGADVLRGGLGDDSMRGGVDDDLYYVDSASDSVAEDSGAGRDRVYSSVSDTLAANVEDIFLRGSSAINATGNGLDNVLRGNSAANVLTGGAGADDYRGGTGADTFVFHDGDFAGLTPSTSDRIIDFSHSEGDRIDLSIVDANSLTAGQQDFAFIGSADFHHVAGELRYEEVNGNTYVYGDTNGDGIADLMIRVDGLHALTSGDFVI